MCVIGNCKGMIDTEMGQTTYSSNEDRKHMFQLEVIVDKIDWLPKNIVTFVATTIRLSNKCMLHNRHALDIYMSTWIGFVFKFHHRTTATDVTNSMFNSEHAELHCPSWWKLACHIEFFSDIGEY